MAKALSVDLRHRVVAAIAEGMSRRQAAARFGVSAASAVRWHQRFKTSGTVAPSRQGGDRRSGRIEAYTRPRDRDAGHDPCRAANEAEGAQGGIGTLCASSSVEPEAPPNCGTSVTICSA